MVTNALLHISCLIERQLFLLWSEYVYTPRIIPVSPEAKCRLLFRPLSASAREGLTRLVGKWPKTGALSRLVAPERNELSDLPS
jgi:hypothetical protein